MWNELYVETDILPLERTQKIISKLKMNPITIDRYDDLWGKSKKPYLHKRDSLNIFLAHKKGQLLKLAPDAYGKIGEPHYYFIHAYNCIYECQYCYLQGYFNTPDIVLFINHEEIMQEMQEVLNKHPDQNVWFHAGEFSDSLALTHITSELELYHGFCERNPRAIIELRTKSVNIRSLRELKPLKNLIISFSLSPAEIGKEIDLKTPSISSRLRAMNELTNLDHQIAAHFDPIIYQESFKNDYEKLLSEMRELGLTQKLNYLSLGVVRFTKDVHKEVQRNYPDSLIHTTPMVKSFDNKVRYNYPMRMWMMNSVKALAIEHQVPEEKIYLCMEENA